MTIQVSHTLTHIPLPNTRKTQVESKEPNPLPGVNQWFNIFDSLHTNGNRVVNDANSQTKTMKQIHTYKFVIFVFLVVTAFGGTKREI